MPFEREGEDLRCFRNACCGVLPWTTWNLQALIFAWTGTYSGLWSQSINSQSEKYRLEYKNTFRRMKFWVEFMKQRGGVVFLYGRGCIPLKHPLLKKPVGLKGAKCHEFLFVCLLPWLVRVREFNFIKMEDIFNALGRKEVIYSLDIHSSLNSSVKECSLSWHRKKVDSPATPV